jgi:hypothetical protein
MDFSYVLADLHGEFRRRQISHAVIGGVAMAVLGVPRTTLDLDFVVDGDRQAEILEVLLERGYAQLHLSSGYSNHVHPDPQRGRVDIVYVRGESRDRLFAQVSSSPGPQGEEVPLPSPEHLAALKAWSIRNDPSRREREMEDLRSLAPLCRPGALAEVLDRYGLSELKHEL